MVNHLTFTIKRAPSSNKKETRENIKKETEIKIRLLVFFALQIQNKKYSFFGF